MLTAWREFCPGSEGDVQLDSTCSESQDFSQQSNLLGANNKALQASSERSELLLVYRRQMRTGKTLTSSGRDAGLKSHVAE